MRFRASHPLRCSRWHPAGQRARRGLNERQRSVALPRFGSGMGIEDRMARELKGVWAYFALACDQLLAWSALASMRTAVGMAVS